MTRRPVTQLLDPLDAIRYKKDRNVTQAADFLQLLGWPISPGALEKLEHEGKLGKKSFNREGKITEQKLIRLIESNPPWLRALPHFNVPEDFLTVRQAMEMYSGLTLDYFLKSLSAGSPSEEYVEDTKRTRIIHESWLRNAATSSNSPLNGPRKPVSQLKQPKPATMRHGRDKGTKIDHHPVTPTTPKEEPAPDVSPEATVPETPACLTKQTCYPVPAMAELLRDIGFGGATEGKIYYYIGRGDIVTIATKPRKLVSEEEIDRLIEANPGWLMREPSRHIPPDGVLTGIMMAEKYGLSQTRTYQVISAKLIEATSMTPDDAGRNIWYISEAAAEVAVNHPTLGAYLRGSKMSLEDLLAALGVDFVAKAPRDHSEPAPSDTPEGVVIVEAASEEAPKTEELPQSEPDHTLEGILDAVHRAKVLSGAYDRGIADGWSDEMFVANLSVLI